MPPRSPWREVAAQKMWPVPEVAVTVLCTLDDGCGWHPKHVERTCRIINILLCVASRWKLLIQISDARNHKHKIGQSVWIAYHVTTTFDTFSFIKPFYLLILTCIRNTTLYTYKTEISILKSNLRIHYTSYKQTYFNLMMSYLYCCTVHFVESLYHTN